MPQSEDIALPSTYTCGACRPISTGWTSSTGCTCKTNCSIGSYWAGRSVCTSDSCWTNWTSSTGCARKTSCSIGSCWASRSV